MLSVSGQKGLEQTWSLGQPVDYLAQSPSNFINIADTVHGMELALLFIISFQWGCFLVVFVKTVSDLAFILIIGTTATLSAFQQTSHQNVIISFQSDGGVHLHVFGIQKVVQGLCLLLGSWKTVKNKAGGLGIFLNFVLEHVYGHLIGHQIPFVNIGFGQLAQFRTVFDVVAEHIP